MLVRLMLVLLLCMGLVAGCGDSNETNDEGQTGSLVFTLNAEDFVRDGFVTEDNWRIDFDHVYINIQGPTAYQVAEETAVEARFKHAGHPHADIAEGTAHEALTGEFFVDGHQGPDPIPLAEVEDAAIGNYNYLNFNIIKATSASEGLVEDYEGYSVVMIGTAKNNDSGDEVAFNIKLTEEMNYISCGPHPENIGVVDVDGQGEAQATFHFDHIFGDHEEGPADTTDEEAINYLAIGFGPFAALAADGVLDVSQADLQSMPEYDRFRDALLTLGHSGEAHCHLE